MGHMGWPYGKKKDQLNGSGEGGTYFLGCTLPGNGVFEGSDLRGELCFILGFGCLSLSPLSQDPTLAPTLYLFSAVVGLFLLFLSSPSLPTLYDPF